MRGLFDSKEMWPTNVVKLTCAKKYAEREQNHGILLGFRKVLFEHLELLAKLIINKFKTWSCLNPLFASSLTKTTI